MLEKFANGWPNIYLQRVIAFSHESPMEFPSGTAARWRPRRPRITIVTAAGGEPDAGLAGAAFPDWLGINIVASFSR
jgi:hypothetical protein